jgi:hypothetical protein
MVSSFLPLHRSIAALFKVAVECCVRHCGLASFLNKPRGAQYHKMMAKGIRVVRH